jgi:hypothetical protein
MHLNTLRQVAWRLQEVNGTSDDLRQIGRMLDEIVNNPHRFNRLSSEQLEELFDLGQQLWEKRMIQ